MSGFIVIPAVDIRKGRCVRLLKGLPQEETVFSQDPAEAALRWQEEGAAMLHVVDLDGAFAGKPVNFETVKRLLDNVRVPAQVGGGIRDLGTAERYLEVGASRVIMGTAAFGETKKLARIASALGERLAVGVDVKAGKIAVQGWAGSVELEPAEAVARLEGAGVRRIIYTEISRDGTLRGPDFDGIERIARSSEIPVIASGGVGDVTQVSRIAAMEDLGVEGVIVGMALYRGAFTLAEALLASGERGDT